MQAVANRYQSQLARIKGNIEKSYLYFKPNYDRFNGFRKQVFETMLDSETIALLKTLKKPQIEFNILEAYISRLRGEFAKQEPSFEVSAGDEGPIDVATIEAVHGHLKHILCEANKDGFEYEIYTDTLSGGFSVVKVFTEYAHEMSFNQNICIGRVYDPTLCGFDPLARLSHKGDGHYCFELYPMRREEFERMYPGADIGNLSFVKAFEGFNWSYKNENVKDEVLILADYYEKVKKKEKIVQLANHKVMTADNYEKFVAEWNESGLTEQPPAVIGKPRTTEIITIARFKLIENQILEHKPTNFKMLPLIFIDGNSILLRHPQDGSIQQMCRPYVYHASGIQKLKNFAGQTLANELENMIQHKFKVAKESLPMEEDYLQAYRDVQQADVLVYNFNNELRPDSPLPAPEVIQRVPIPPEVTQTFQGADQLTQTILGNFDMDLGRLNKSQVSGVAVQESITQSNSAAMPYIVGYLQGLGRISEMIIDLIPRYWKTPRTMPVVGLDGKRTYVEVNQQGQEGQKIDLQYDDNALNVRVDAGVNWSVQKAKALNMIQALMQSSELFSQFMNTAGLDILLDNIEIKGIDQIKQAAKQWMQEMQQAKREAQQQQQQQGNPIMMQAMIEKMKLEQKAQEAQIDARIKAAELAIEKQKADTEQLVALANIGAEKDNRMIAMDKADAEKARAAVDLAIKELDVRKHHDHNERKLHHEIIKAHHERNSR